MSYTYDQRKRPQGRQDTEPERTSAPGPGMDALMSGAAAPTAAQKGRSIDLDAAMKAKMEHAFGDLSAVKLYESRAVGDAGAEAVARGNEIAFAPGMADFSTRSGQERLGHELSHVMSQRSGAVRGTGFLANAALEARADREGAMAAAGQQVYTGPVTHALSDASPAPSVAGPMQAKRDDEPQQQVPVHQPGPGHHVTQSLPAQDFHSPAVGQAQNILPPVDPEPTEEENEAGLDELFSEYRTYGKEIHSGDYNADYLYNKATMVKMVNSLVENRQRVYEMENDPVKLLNVQNNQNNNNILQEDDDFNISIDEDQPENNNILEEPIVDYKKQAAMKEIKRQAMIQGLTKMRKYAVLRNWDRYDVKEDPDPENENRSKQAVKRRKNEATRQNIARSRYFKRWMQQKKQYSNMSYDELEQAYKNMTDEKLRHEFETSYYKDNWYLRPIVKGLLWSKGVYKQKALAPNVRFDIPAVDLQSPMKKRSVRQDAGHAEPQAPAVAPAPQFPLRPVVPSCPARDLQAPGLSPEATREQFAAMKRQQKAHADAERLFRIQHAFLAESLGEDKHIVSKEDQKWYDDFNRNPENLTEELSELLYKQRIDAAKKLLKTREEMGKANPNADPDQLDLEAAGGDAGVDFEIREMVQQAVNFDTKDNPALDAFNNHGVNWGKSHPEEMKFVEDAAQLGVNSSSKTVLGSRYSKSPEGRKRADELLEARIKRSKALYNQTDKNAVQDKIYNEDGPIILAGPEPARRKKGSHIRNTINTSSNKKNKNTFDHLPPISERNSLSDDSDLIIPIDKHPNMNAIHEDKSQNKNIINIQAPEDDSIAPDGLSTDPKVIAERRKKSDKERSEYNEQSDEYFRPGMKELADRMEKKYNDKTKYS